MGQRYDALKDYSFQVLDIRVKYSEFRVMSKKVVSYQIADLIDT